MEIIRVAIDAKLLQACDRAAKKATLNRSELVRLALGEYLQRLQILESEQHDRRGYKKVPQSTDEFAWEAEAAWPQA